MIANYHTHTVRCTHAVGSEEEYVLAGIEAGLKILGFSDHAPYPFEGGCYSHIRMRPEELGAYTATVFALREKYKDLVQIPVGVEIEYFPRFWEEQLSMLRDHGIEYLLLGQHWAEYREGGHYSGKVTDREDLLAEYCRSACEAMQTGVITYIAHPDLFHYVGDEKVYERHMRKLCREAKGCDLPLEVNMVGMRNNRNYPNHRFWELAAEEGCRAILGNDAHDPRALLDTETMAQARIWVEALGMELLETVPLQRF